MRKVRPLGQVTGRKASMPAVSYSSVRDLTDNELRNLRTPRRKISEPLAPSTVLLGRQVTSLNAGLSPSESPTSERRMDNRLSPMSRRPTLIGSRRTSEPSVLSILRRPSPSVSPSYREPSPLLESRCSTHLQPSLAPTPPSPRQVTTCAEAQANIVPDPSLIQRWRALEEEVVVLQSNQTELENNVHNCGVQSEEYKRLYEAELCAHQRSRETKREVEANLKEMASRRQKLLVEHESAVSTTKREFTIRTDGVRREHSQNINSFAKKLLTLGACLPTKTTAVNERQSQLALLLKDKQTLLDEIDSLRERVAQIQLGEEECEEDMPPCEPCEKRALELDRMKQECSKREERIAKLQQKIRFAEGNTSTKSTAPRLHSARSSVAQRRT